MKRLLIHDSAVVLAPYCASSRLATFADEDIPFLNFKITKLFLRDANFLKIF